MKQTKKLTYRERAIVSSWGLNPENWRREKLADGMLHLRNTITNELRYCPERVREKR